MVQRESFIEVELRFSVDVFPTNAGEVGDGPDQGHSGGADSVPPAPNSFLPAVVIG
jgi:hypothetical protein